MLAACFPNQVFTVYQAHALSGLVLHDLINGTKSNEGILVTSLGEAAAAHPASWLSG